MEGSESVPTGRDSRPTTDREQRRLRTLEQYDVLEAPPQQAFDRITRLATRLFDVSAALLNFIDQDRQWCLSGEGLDLGRTSLEVSFCVHTLDHKGVMVVEDATADDRFADNPLVTGEPHIRFYAGAPLTAPNGYRLGTLCLLDDEPRCFSEDDQGTLSDLAGVVMDELNVRHYAAGLDASRQAHRETSWQRTRILESITDAFVAVDEDWNFTYVNAQAEVMLERYREDLVGENLWEEFPEAMGTQFHRKYETAMDEEKTVEFIEYYSPLNRWFEVKAFPFDRGLSVYFDDVTDRMEARENLRRERNLTEAIMDTTVTALVIVDAAGKVSFVNDSASDILGVTVDDLIGQVHHHHGTLKSLGGTVIPVGEWPFQHVLESGTPIAEKRYVFERPDGQERYISLNGAPLRNQDGEIRQVVFSVDDITEQVRYERELRAAKEDAEQANELKSAFLANMSHDVQTPLSSIMNHADLLRREVSEEHQDRVDLIKRSSTRLLDTLDSMLDLSKLEAGAVEATPESINLADELLGTAEIFQPEAMENEITLETDVEEPLPAELDPSILHRITDNLLSNALKFTEAGGTVTLRAYGENGVIAIEVEDTGIGIEPEFLPTLFEAFSRGGNAAETEGSGLGLAITKHLTEVMGGSIHVESEKGVGSTFTVRRPRELE